MVHLVTGTRGSGKSSVLQTIYAGLSQGDGIVNLRLYTCGMWTGQEIMRLSTGECVPFSCRDGYAPDGWDILWRLGSLSFSRNGMAFAVDTIDEIIRKGVMPVFLDEVGPLELNGMGLHQQFAQLIRLGWPIYVVVRQSCLDDVIRLYRLHDYVIIQAAARQGAAL